MLKVAGKTMQRLFVLSVLALAVIVSLACEGPEPTPAVPPAPQSTVPPATTLAMPSPSMPWPTLTIAPTPTPEPTPTVPAPEPTLAPAPTPTPTQEPTREPEPTAATGEQIDWTTTSPWDWGAVAVPADYRDPEAGSINIAVSVHRATAPDQRIGYLFVNPGGPGMSGLELSLGPVLGMFTDEIIERFDIVGFDPRGVGLSDTVLAVFDELGIDPSAVGSGSDPEFACGGLGEQIALLATIDGDIDTPEEIAAGEAAANLCIQSMGPVGGLLHTEYVARDMDEIRQALGAEQISYYGAGYGAALGGWYATLFPESVRAMVVDSADNPDDPAGTRQERIDEQLEEIAPFEAALEAALRACHDPRECPIYNDGDPIGYFKQAAAKLELVDRAANDHPLAGVLGVITTLYAEVGRPALWYGLFELNENDDPAILLDLALTQIGEPGAASFTGHVNCLDGWALSPVDRKTLLEESEILDAIIEEQFPLLASMPIVVPEACFFYDQFAPDPFEGPLDGGGVPILVIGNHSDPITSFGESEELAAEALSNGYLVEVSHAEHVVYPANQCVNERIHRALIDGVYPGERRVVCEEEEIRLAEELPWTECASNIECLKVSVPADYRHPEAGTIDIYIDVHWATSPEQRIGYLFVNPGGPGASGVQLVAGTEYGQFTDEIVERFDIIGFDPRGVGFSDPEFACGDLGEQLAMLATIEGDIDTSEEIAAGEAAANLCINSMGPVGGRMHSEYVARDMDEIRKALGADQISYLGFSYGSALGVWYATLFPESVRAMVVDGADDPVDAATTQQERIAEEIEEISGFSNLLEQALAACAGPECPIYNDGDPVGYYNQAAPKLGLVNAAAGYPSAAYLGVISTLYSEGLWPELWQGLFELNENDDPSILVKSAEFQLLGRDPGAASFTEHVNCLDGWVLHPELDRATRLADSKISEATIEEMFPLLAIIDQYAPTPPSACLFYDQFAPEPLDVPLDGGDVPILVVGNQSDPATSFGESEELATEVLSNGYLLETDHFHHVVYPENNCVNQHVHRALIDGEYPSERRVFCERED